MIVDSAIYVNGKRGEPCPLEEMPDRCRKTGGFAWIELREPEWEELETVAHGFGLPEPAAREAIRAHQRPKIEHYGGSMFVTLKSARYVDEREEVEFGEVHLFAGPEFIITVSYGESSRLDDVRRKLEQEPGVLRRGPMTVLYVIMSRVVECYIPVVEGLQNDVDGIEGQVFGGNPGVSRRIYELSREVIQFHRATRSLADALQRLTEEGSDEKEPENLIHLRGINERLVRIVEQVENFRELLSNILNVNLTMVSVQQNNQVQKISAWAAILVVPTIITGIYGMNFRYMPELSWFFGYPLSLLLMVVVSALLYLGFKRSGWL